ncbi:TetR/AcrR family transcriptional regulator [Paracoccus caeni]|uniref:TetR/AcrR family transcriptional regulator n=1 Tax=Paracoccus caeni TaxID=657651 RepID=A0A934SII5_9RHOB|nr:TetR-like C-terminal domain-containing protein [Paracoccus caeni]MBK4215779.1 TetR/AcrR family transcriptional regulator [Paracoccus caeni]
MSRHDRIMEGMGLHGRAIVTALDVMAETRSARPSMDEICERMGVGAEDLRGIFADEHSLLVAVAEQALVRLIDATTRAIVKVEQDDPIGQFLALGDVYMEWAAQYPTQFRLVTDNSLVDGYEVPELRRYIDSLSELMIRTLSRAQDRGDLPATADIPKLVLTTRIFCHGLARMLIDGRLHAMQPDASALQLAKSIMRDTVRHFTLPAGRAA